MEEAGWLKVHIVDQKDVDLVVVCRPIRVSCMLYGPVHIDDLVLQPVLVDIHKHQGLLGLSLLRRLDSHLHAVAWLHVRYG